MNNKILDPWYTENLVCPIDKEKLKLVDNYLICSKNKHKFLIYKNIPIMLVDEYIPNKNNFTKKSLDLIKENKSLEDYFNKNLEKHEIDEHVQKVIAATNSNFYKNVVGKLEKYPIPNFPLRKSKGNLLLDIGCGWGRWTISSCNSGFQSVGIDPSIKSVLAARKVAKQLGINSRFIVGDACYMPFKENLFDYCFSYSVLQHFEKNDVLKVLKEIRFILKTGGISKIQMLNKFGLRSICVLSMRKFKKKKFFDTNYYSPKKLKEIFKVNIGETEIELGSFFTQAQISDFKLFTTLNKIILIISLIFKRLTSLLPLLKNFADNLFIISKK